MSRSNGKLGENSEEYKGWLKQKTPVLFLQVTPRKKLDADYANSMKSFS